MGLLVIGLFVGSTIGFFTAALFASGSYDNGFEAGHLRGTRDARARR